jgi:hypothetical protein
MLGSARPRVFGGSALALDLDMGDTETNSDFYNPQGIKEGEDWLYIQWYQGHSLRFPLQETKG